ncbi:MAG TPA: hypothetical protein PKY31_09750 [Spirochaetota bacterium]|nr:hypothetical protein [Spirochaetota bacterium]
MADILSALEKSYLARCSDPAARRAAWGDVVAEFTPSLGARTPDGLVPATAIARDTGDLGLALLWIVQAAVVRPIAADVVRGAERYHPALAALSPEKIGALAHSEDPAAPVVLERSGGGIRLFGKKKYITGGLDTDFILVTAREKGDDIVTSLVYVPRSAIPDGALSDLSMGILKTVSHASLTLDGITLPGEHLAVMEPAALRRHLKRWGLVERCLIMEAFSAAMRYLALRLEAVAGFDPADTASIGTLLEERRRVSLEAVAAAEAGNRVETGAGDLGAIMGLFGKIGAACDAPGASLPEDLSLRRGDLTLFSRLRP